MLVNWLKKTITRTECDGSTKVSNRFYESDYVAIVSPVYAECDRALLHISSTEP